MNQSPDNFFEQPQREPHDSEQAMNALPPDIAGLGSLLDSRGQASRRTLSSGALDRIASMSDLQLPLAHRDEPLVLARVGSSSRQTWLTRPSSWRIAAAIVAVAGIGAAAYFVARAALDRGTPAPGTLVEVPPSAEHALPAPTPGLRSKSIEHLDRALAQSGRATASTSSASVSTMLVALSSPRDEAALPYNELDEASEAEIASFLSTSSLLDGGGTTYEDLSGEFAAIVAPGSFR